MSKTFWLKMGLSLSVLALLAGASGLPTETVSAQKRTKAKSLCVGNEQTIWTCSTVKNKTASVCASKDLAEDKGYVQYRFGQPGKIEMEFPKERKDSAQKFKYARYTRPLVTMLSLKFENEGVTYEIRDDDNSEEKPPVRTASIDVTNGGKESSVECKTPVKGSLMKLETIVPQYDYPN